MTDDTRDTERPGRHYQDDGPGRDSANDGPGRRSADVLPEDRVEKLLRELEPADLPPFYAERIRARVRAASRRGWVERLRSPVFAWAVAGACALALVLVAIGTDRNATTIITAPGQIDVAQSGIDPVTPADNSVVGADDVEIVAAIYPPVERGIVRLYVDETDVTGLADVTESYVMYSPPDKLSEGEHIITIEIRDETGHTLKDVSWLFYALNGGRPSGAGSI